MKYPEVAAGPVVKANHRIAQRVQGQRGPPAVARIAWPRYAVAARGAVDVVAVDDLEVLVTDHRIA